MSAPRVMSSSAVPPYWQAHQRTTSNASSVSFEPAAARPITLEDRTDEQVESWDGLWAKAVTIDDYTVVSGLGIGAGSYVVWNCSIETLDGGIVKIRKRYSDFDRLRQGLQLNFAEASKILPDLPPKSIISRFRPSFLEKRRQGIAFFLNCLLLNPQFAGAPVLKEFITS